MAQSMSILRFLCVKWGYYPNDPELIYACETIIDYRQDVMQEVIPIVMKLQGDDRTKAITEWYVTKLPIHMKKAEEWFKKYTGGTGYFIGKTMTMADFVWVDVYTRMNLHPDRKEMGMKALEHCPDLRKYFETRAVDFQTYLETRPQTWR